MFASVRKRAVAGGALLLAASSVAAQDLKQDLLRMSRAYSGSDCIKAQVVVEATASGTSRLPLLRRQIAIGRWGERFRYDMDGVTMLITPRLAIIVDHRARTLTVSAHTTLDPIVPRLEETQARLDSALASADSVRFLGIASDGKHYAIYNQATIPRRVDIYIDPVAFLLRRLVYADVADPLPAPPADSRSVERVDIRYAWERPAVPDSASFSEARFVSRQGDQLRAAPPFAEYRIREVPGHE